MRFINAIIDFLTRYKILHIAFWVWTFIGLIHDRLAWYEGTVWTHLSDVITITATQMLGVYFTIYFLVPRFLKKGKYFYFFFLTLLWAVVTSVLNTAILYYYTLWVEGLITTNPVIITITHFIDTLEAIIIFTAVVVIASLYQADQRNKFLEREQLRTELAFLKAQLNPHFMFNALNSIYVLIDIDKQQASNTLLRFSDLLRYQLYEGKSDKIPLNRELKFIRDFISIEKMRLNNEDVKLSFNTDGKTDYFQISPFILIPFIENAFKHISLQQDRDNFIKIDIEVEDDFLDMTVENTYDEERIEHSEIKRTGIGLVNVERRLKLLYPDRYELDTIKSNGIYTVHLKLLE